MERLISKIYILYIEIIYRTCRIKLSKEFDSTVAFILGFYHTDSFIMNLLIKEFSNDNVDIDVVVTANKRGNYIENVIKRYGGKALRMADGNRIKDNLAYLKEESKVNNKVIAIALDGPLGPYKEPKKLGYMLSNISGKAMILVEVKYSRCIRLNNRWDRYVIPLPFTKISYNINELGIIDKNMLKNYRGISKNT